MYRSPAFEYRKNGTQFLARNIKIMPLYTCFQKMFCGIHEDAIGARRKKVQFSTRYYYEKLVVVFFL